MSGQAADPAVVDAVLTASRTLLGVTTRSLGAAAEHTTVAQHRVLVVLASRGPQRLIDLAEALEVAPSTAGRMTDRLERKKLVRRHRARADRRVVHVSLTAAGRLVLDQATARRRLILAEILGQLPVGEQQAIAAAFQLFAAASGEIPDSMWPPVTADKPAPPAGKASGHRRARTAAANT